MTIATKLKLPTAERRLVEVGALLHDVGKLSIPDRVLMKPGPLNELEWAVMQRHAPLGERLVAHTVNQADVLAIVRSHHERWDGRGYPTGLAADAIPLPGRIVALADVFDALANERPYKEAWPLDQALEEIMSLSETHFDPDVVEAFAKLDHSARIRQQSRIDA